MNLTITYLRVVAGVRSWLGRLSAEDGERGDVPGWVLVTVMTAALVAALYAVAGDRLTSLLSDAFDDVLNP